MNKLYSLFLLGVILFVNLFFCPEVFAEGGDRFITVVNPVRISKYSKTPEKSLNAEYAVIKEFDLPATWLLTYDALSDKKVILEINKMDRRQEFGIFLEVTQSFSSDSGVSYHDSGFWQHANSVFLSGYTQDERKKLIDKVFEKYKEVFGRYPKSVGSWWTDSYSLNYINEKYGVITNLICSDQYATDGYQIWGQPWQMAYYPSKNHPAIPASNLGNKLNVVNIQWASRDPLNGYESSLFSTQDYVVTTKTLDIEYFKKLVDFYLLLGKESGFSQITVGLEADLDAGGYKGEYAKQMGYVKEMNKKRVSVVTMSDFADWYIRKFQDLSPKSSLDSNDFLGTKRRAYWNTTSKYRLHYVKDEGKNIIQIMDLRTYNSDISDPYETSPNRSFNLAINTPAIIDGIQNQEDIWEIPGDSKIKADEDKITISGKNINIPSKLLNSPLARINKNKETVEIIFLGSVTPKDGVEIKGYSSEAIHFFSQKKAFLYLLSGKGWNYIKKISYLIPQGEIYALYYLKTLGSGSVLVYKGECLQCEYHTPLKPPAFSGIKSYVKEYSSKPIVYDKTVFEATNRDIAKHELNKTGVKYVYLVKFEDYNEKLPFSPGDLGIEKIFSNANAEIWKVK